MSKLELLVQFLPTLPSFLLSKELFVVFECKVTFVRISISRLLVDLLFHSREVVSREFPSFDTQVRNENSYENSFGRYALILLSRGGGTGEQRTVLAFQQIERTSRAGNSKSKHAENQFCCRSESRKEETLGNSDKKKDFPDKITLGIKKLRKRHAKSAKQQQYIHENPARKRIENLFAFHFLSLQSI